MGGNPTIFQGSMDSHQFPRESRSHAHITWPLQKLIVEEDFDFVSFWDGTGATVDGSQIRREQQLIIQKYVSIYIYI